MQHRPLPIRGLPLAPPVQGLTVLEDVVHATSSHSRPSIAPFPISQDLAAAAAQVAKRQRRHGSATAYDHPRQYAVAAAAAADIDRSFFPVRRFRKAIPELVPIRPDAFAAHRHPLAIRTPLDVVRFYPVVVSASAALAGISGLLAGGIANRLLGGVASPALFMAGYLALFLLNLWSHYLSAKGQLFFVNKRRFLGLFAANALLLLPHFITHSVLIGIAEK
jgi:hypothetical protein